MEDCAFVSADFSFQISYLNLELHGCAIFRFSYGIHDHCITLHNLGTILLILAGFTIIVIIVRGMSRPRRSVFTPKRH
jgi:hypothetical protein